MSNTVKILKQEKANSQATDSAIDPVRAKDLYCIKFDCTEFVTIKFYWYLYIFLSYDVIWTCPYLRYHCGLMKKVMHLKYFSFLAWFRG